ncbi:hypothetical protein JOB18_043901 [Solea senegalensis]|uniref:Uncharacterized protein n=1 Tax=Solea senegalensis TaxID=28829 RepID=A0AAV6RK68_SOLSE|nr:uncharacterized protein LOC122785124 [Solea senegalensis]KAG7505957.1 hypothetical protein JOB18_043901 [Solea senegalensis]
MGNSQSETRGSTQSEMDIFLRDVADGPDLTVDKNIVMFCGLESSKKLKGHFEKRKSQSFPTADWIKKLAEVLADLVLDPKLAGLGALSVAIIIDVLSASPDGTQKALEKVFADQKAFMVWNLVDECLKRCRAYIDDEDKLRSNIGRIEVELSAALTTLKNSMLAENQISSQAVRAWVNGVAFHIHMMIHLVRLGGISNYDPVTQYLTIYQKEVDQVFKQHRVMIESKCWCQFNSEMDAFSMSPAIQFLVDENSVPYLYQDGDYNSHFKAFYEHRYGRQESAIRQYFRDVEQNLHGLVHQEGRFRVE